MLTPENVLSDCIRALPAFGPYWDADDIFRYEDGSFSECGVYSTLSCFLRERWQGLAESDWRALAAVVSDHYRRSEDPGDYLGPCLIEGLEGEAYSPLVARYFEDEVLRAFDFEE